MTEAPEQAGKPEHSGRPRLRLARPTALDLVDVLAYLLVLGVFIQLFPAVIAESFLVAALTALLLKLTLEIVLRLKTAVVRRTKAAPTTMRKVLGLGVLFIVMAGSKFVVIELTAWVFGDAVRLGGFFQVTALILCLMATRALLRRLVARPS